MKISEQTIKALVRVTTGNSEISPYQSGPNLVAIFNQLGFQDIYYGSGFPSRWDYTEEKIRQLNDTPELDRLFSLILDPRQYFDTQFDLEAVVDYLNKHLDLDGYKLVRHGNVYKASKTEAGSVELTLPFDVPKELAQVFINEQVIKCDRKIIEGDYDGAITNARSLVEAVLIGVERQVVEEPTGYDGDLIKLYRRVQRLLNLEPTRQDISETLRQVLSGLNSTVAGLAGLRNKMSDSHFANYRPEKHHAKLAVNAAKTVADFLFETMRYQEAKGTLNLKVSHEAQNRGTALLTEAANKRQKEVDD